MVHVGPDEKHVSSLRLQMDAALPLCNSTLMISVFRHSPVCDGCSCLWSCLCRLQLKTRSCTASAAAAADGELATPSSVVGSKWTPRSRTWR